MDSHYYIILLIAIALIFDFLNGFNDSANIAATIIASRSMRPRAALNLAALAGFAGPFLFGVAIAKTIASDIVIIDFITIHVLIAALCGAASWSLITWLSGIPVSSSHALIGGLVGAVLIAAGSDALLIKGIIKIIIVLLTSPLAGFIFGWIMVKILYMFLRYASPKANMFFKWGQVPTAIALAAGNAANDAQKTMGIIALGLMVTGYQQHFFVPTWVVFACASVKSLGSFVGGWRIIKVMGSRFYRIKPLHSFSSQLASSLIIITASLLGGPVSTTQVVSMSVIGAGAGERLSMVRWTTLKDIMISWVLTVPLAGLMAVPFYWLLKFFTH